MNKIQFTKPEEFQPIHTISVIKNRALLFPIYAAFFFFCFVSIFNVLTGHLFEFFLSFIIIATLLPLTTRARRIAKNSNIIELSHEGVWLNIYNLWIPRRRFLSATEQKSHMFIPTGTYLCARNHNISIMINVTKQERRLMRKQFIFSKKISKAELNQLIISLTIPCTTGTVDNIGLNYTKPEVINAFNILKN